MSDDEVLLVNNDLTRHLISEGFSDFNTYSRDMPNQSSRFPKGDYPSVLNAEFGYRPMEITQVSYHDYSKLMNLLKSKLLLPEDFELMEFLVNRSAISNSQDIHLWIYGSSVVASTISLALFLTKRISIILPVTLVATASLLSLRQCYNFLGSLSENRSFISAIGSLQSLCLNVNKLLRLLKETEVLSTGQVTTNNIGAALYIPVRSLADQVTLPAWKTLPHLRKSLANALLDINILLKTACAEAREIVPDWLHIEGYTLSNECSLPGILSQDWLLSTDYISLKDLQLLNDSYLVLQSELLRWVGFCLCPSAWSAADLRYKSSRINILKLFHRVYLDMRVISLKLKMQYDIQNIFIKSKQVMTQKPQKSDKTDIHHVQSDLHRLYLLILSMLTQVKNLEDQLDSNSVSTTNASLNNLQETVTQKLKKVRGELTSAVDMFNEICLKSFPIQKTYTIQNDKLDEERIEKTNSKSQNREESQFDCCANALDEVFLTIADIMPCDREREREVWDVESKPPIPITYMAELSTTLKPIKESFREREKAALERAGLEDIVNDSESDSQVSDEESSVNYSSKPVSGIEKKKMLRKLKRTNYEPLISSHEDTESESSALSREDSVNDLNKISIDQNTSTPKNETSTENFPILTDKSIASIIAMRSKTWGLPEEEHYSDN